MLRVSAVGARHAHVRDGAQHHNCEEDALDTVKPEIANAFSLHRQWRDFAGY